MLKAHLKTLTPYEGHRIFKATGETLRNEPDDVVMWRHLTRHWRESDQNDGYINNENFQYSLTASKLTF